MNPRVVLDVLGNLKSNKDPILEYVWQVFFMPFATVPADMVIACYLKYWITALFAICDRYVLGAKCIRIQCSLNFEKQQYS